MRYFALFQHDTKTGGFTVTFRDIPEIVTQGTDFVDALEMASDALDVLAGVYEEQGRFLPDPTSAQHGEVAVFMREKE